MRNPEQTPLFGRRGARACWGCGDEPHVPGACAGIPLFSTGPCRCTADDRTEKEKAAAAAGGNTDGD